MVILPSGPSLSALPTPPQGWLAIEALPAERREKEGERVVPSRVQVSNFTRTRTPTLHARARQLYTHAHVNFTRTRTHSLAAIPGRKVVIININISDDFLL
jgi:hypothetical protein